MSLIIDLQANVSVVEKNHQDAEVSIDLNLNGVWCFDPRTKCRSLSLTERAFTQRIVRFDALPNISRLHRKTILSSRQRQVKEAEFQTQF